MVDLLQGLVAEQALTQGLRQASRQLLRQQGLECSVGSGLLPGPQLGSGVFTRQQIDVDGIALFPVGRNLQDDRAAQPPVGDE